MKKLLSLLLALVMCLSLAACGEKKPLVTLDSSEITVNADGTFEITGTMSKAGISLEIDGANLTTVYSDYDTFTASVQMGDPVDSAVLTASCYSETEEITLSFDTSAYVTALEQEEVAQAETAALQSLTGGPLTDTIAAIAETEYTATYYADGEDFTEFVDDLAEDYTTGEVKVDAYNKTVEVEMLLTSNIEAEAARDALEKTLSTGSAWVAVENYGEAIYPYGFELHYFLGKIAEDMDDENTWFLKATCDVFQVMPP